MAPPHRCDKLTLIGNAYRQLPNIESRLKRPRQISMIENGSYEE
jgi:hypothetical protein